MRVECDGCGTFVDANILSSFSELDEFSDASIEYSFLKCPSCGGPILISRDFYHVSFDEIEYSHPKILYPKFTRNFQTEIPDNVQFNYEEAEKCLKIKAYTAMAVMCRRTLESICDHFDCKKEKLIEKIEQLRERLIIDETISKWATMLRLEGNSAAHDMSERVTAENAKDIIDFTHALIEYTFTYKKKFSDFQKRKGKRDASRVNENEDYIE